MTMPGFPQAARGAESGPPGPIWDGRKSSSPGFRRPGFSLVEVVLALGIASFALVTIVALLPVGLKMASESENESRAVNILSAVAADRMATPFGLPSREFGFPSLTNTVTEGFLLVEEDGTATADEDAARYRVGYQVIPPASLSLEPYRVWLRISSPAQNTNPATFFETIVSFAQP